MSHEEWVPASLLDELFPFHFSFDGTGRVIRVGPALGRIRPEVTPGASATELLRLQLPARPLTVDLGAESAPSLLVVETAQGGLWLRGQFVPLPLDATLFVGTPWFNDMAEMQALGITFDDLPPHTAQASSLFLMRSSQVAVEDSRRLSDQLRAANLQLRTVLETAAEGRA